MSTSTLGLDRAGPATDQPVPGDRGRAPLRLSPPLRKAILTLHVAVSVAWLGLDIGLLVLGITGLTTRDPETLRAAYLAMGVFGDVLVIPVSLTALVSGVVLSLGTPWGLVRYYWVLIKLVLTTGAATASIFALRAQIATAVAGVRGVPAGELVATGVGDAAVSLVAAPTVAFVIYLTATVLSVYKPWGRTPYGRRKAAEAAAGARRPRPARPAP